MILKTALRLLLAEKRPNVERAVRDFSWITGPVNLWSGGWQGWPGVEVAPEDVSAWPDRVGFLVKVVSFLNTNLHWPAEVADIGRGGVLSVSHVHWVDALEFGVREDSLVLCSSH